jgi:hypothetical protein
MKRFAQLFAELDATTSTRVKLDALKRYFGEARAADAAWAVYFLAGGKPRQVVGTRALREFVIAASGLPAWLVEESYHAVGDFAETVALLLPPPARSGDTPLAEWVEHRLLPLRGKAPADVLAALSQYVDELETGERFLLFKLIGGGFRIGVSRLLVTRALAEHAGLEPRTVAQRMIGYTDIAAMPTAERYAALVARDAVAAAGDPYPFFLAHALQLPLERFDAELGPAATGWPNGSTTASARNWSSAPVRLALVARRGTDHRPLSGGCAAARQPARRHGARRRTDGVARCCPAAVRAAAKAHHAQDSHRRACSPTHRPHSSPMTCWNWMAR